MKIPISEIFFSLQGEGRNVGKPSVFVRFWGCNLKCTWCDSKYSWDPKEEKAQMMDLEEVIIKIASFDCSHIIFTGGEPTLFQEQMLAIQKGLEKARCYSYELETNGSKKLIEGLDFEQVNVSPKLKSSGNNQYELEIFKDDKFNQIRDLKFVAGSMQDLVEIDQCIKKLEDDFCFYISIYIMPLGRDFQSQMNKVVMDYCMKKGYNFCMRAHLIWFGDGPGK